MRRGQPVRPVIAWDMVRALLREHEYSGPAILHCSNGQPMMLEIPSLPSPGLKFEIDNQREKGRD